MKKKTIDYLPKIITLPTPFNRSRLGPNKVKTKKNMTLVKESKCNLNNFQVADFR